MVWAIPLHQLIPKENEKLKPHNFVVVLYLFLFKKLLIYVALLCVLLGKPMGAVSAFTAGNYHCQPLDVVGCLIVFQQLMFFLVNDRLLYDSFCDAKY